MLALTGQSIPLKQVAFNPQGQRLSLYKFRLENKRPPACKLRLHQWLLTSWLLVHMEKASCNLLRFKRENPLVVSFYSKGKILLLMPFDPEVGGFLLASFDLEDKCLLYAFPQFTRQGPSSDQQAQGNGFLQLSFDSEANGLACLTNSQGKNFPSC